MPVELYRDDKHVCLAFYDLVDDERDFAVQANQFLISDSGEGALIDPGGNMTYNGLLMAMQKYFPSKELQFIFASHADPDIVASINKWFVVTKCRLAISTLWARFIPHFTTGRDVEGRIIGLPDEGCGVPLGSCSIKALPAHFMHAEGNFQFYDPVSKILFSGDLGVSLVDHEHAALPVADFDAHIAKMEAFHRRYMVSNKILRYWANMVRRLDIEMIVPQHGQRFVGKAMCNRLIDWVEKVECGVDLMTQKDYSVP